MISRLLAVIPFICEEIYEKATGKKKKKKKGAVYVLEKALSEKGQMSENE